VNQGNSGTNDGLLLESLKRELLLRSKRNPRYSLRAFARSLGVDQSLLSKIISEKRTMGAPTRLRMEQALGLSLRSRLGRPQSMGDEAIEVLSDWIHFALLELLQIPSQRQELGSLASALNTSTVEVRAALERLQKLKFLAKEKGRWIVLSPQSDWASQRGTSEARKRLQKQLLQKAVEAIDRFKLHERENYSLTLAMSPALLPEIKSRIRKFQAELNDLAASHGKYQGVYQLCIAFYPLTETRLRKKGESK